MCRRTEEEVGPTVGLQRHRHFVGFFNVPVLAPTRTTLFIRWFRHTAPFSRLLRSRWGYGGAHSRLNPPGPHEKRTNWDAHLPYVLMTYRASVHESTKCTPNLLTIYHPHITLETDVRTRMLNGYKMLCNGHLSLRMKTFNLVSWNRNVTMTWSTNRDDTVSGDNVWRFFPPQTNQKLGSGWSGPYRITRILAKSHTRQNTFLRGRSTS